MGISLVPSTSRWMICVAASATFLVSEKSLSTAKWDSGAISQPAFCSRQGSRPSISAVGIKPTRSGTLPRTNRFAAVKLFAGDDSEDFIMLHRLLLILVAGSISQPILAATIRVPQDHKTIQAAIDASNPGDTILVAPGKYQERIRLKSGIVLRSEGTDAKGADGLKRKRAPGINLRRK